MNKSIFYSRPGWVCPKCKAVVTLTEKDEVELYDYKCPSCGTVSGADEWRERLNAEWIEHKNSYRLYKPERIQDTVAYVDTLDEADRSRYDVVLCEEV